MKLDTKYDTFVGQKVLVDVTPREYKGFSCDKYDLNKDDTTMLIRLTHQGAEL